MLAAFNISVLEALGYNDSIFIDPREEIFAPEAATADKFTEGAILDKINFLANLRPYADIAEREEELEEYYAENPEANYEK